MYHGMINVYKEKGFTSHDAVAKLRGICKQKKIGHTGTLDPEAVGVLPVCLGAATKVCDMLTDTDKEYIASFQLGITTDTQDMTGNVLKENLVSVSEEETRQAIQSFAGKQLQEPPMYSALKVNGKKLYELAREGKEVERAKRPVMIYEIELLKSEMPVFTIRVNCSKGTYIRTLCHDIGQRLGCGAAMRSLERTRAGAFQKEKAHTLSEIQALADENRLQEALIPIEKMFEELPMLKVKESAEKALVNGNQLRERDLQALSDGNSFREEESSALPFENQLRERELSVSSGEAVCEGRARVYGHEGKFYGVYKYDEKRRLFCPEKLFFT